MMQIYKGLPSAKWKRYRLLRIRKVAGTLTEAGYEELLAINDEIELANAQRLEALDKLAALRGVSVRELMVSLGLASPV